MRLLSNLSNNQVQSASEFSFPTPGGATVTTTNLMDATDPKKKKFNTREILSGALAGASALASMGEANAEAGGLEAEGIQFGYQADQQSILAEQQGTLGVQQVTQILQDFGGKKANLQVGLNASGISGGATVQASFDQLQEAEERALSNARFDTRTRVLNALQSEAALRQSAAASKTQAKSTRRAAKFGAFGDLLGYGLKEWKRKKDKEGQEK